jgi:hypothetical protein
MLTIKHFIPLIPYLVAIAIGFMAWLIATNAFRPVWPFTLWRTKKKKSPVKQKLLAYPGKTLANTLEDRMMDFLPLSLLLIMGPSVAWLFYVLFVQPSTTSISILTFVVPMLVGTAAGCISLRRTARKMRYLRLGLDAERATGEELNQLMREGFYVFHDFPAESFNIDHILIGPSGVYSVETKSRAKLTGKGTDGASVQRNGDTLQFPTYLDRESIPQARRQAMWLEKFLRDSVGKEIQVQAVLALPGWFITHGSHNGKVLVINPLNSQAFFKKHPVCLDDQTVKQVAFQLEQRCRTITPFDPY